MQLAGDPDLLLALASKLAADADAVRAGGETLRTRRPIASA